MHPKDFINASIELVAFIDGIGVIFVLAPQTEEREEEDEVMDMSKNLSETGEVVWSL